MKHYPFKCPKCGHMRLDRVGEWEGCERRQCGYEGRVTAPAQPTVSSPSPPTGDGSPTHKAVSP